MQVRKLNEQEGIMAATKQTNADTRTAALEAKLGVTFSQPEEGNVKKMEGKTPKKPAWRRNRGSPAVTCQASGSKCKDPS